MANYINGAVSVQPGMPPTEICTVPAENDGVLIQNAGTAPVFFGGPNVDTAGPNQGLSVAAGAIQELPSVGGTTNTIYGISLAVAQTIIFLIPDTD